MRKAVDEGRADYTPVFPSEISSLFSDGTLALDAALVNVSPPDEFGYCSLGPGDTRAIDKAKGVIAQINPQVPRTATPIFISAK